jgi:hypothetical protein
MRQQTQLPWPLTGVFAVLVSVVGARRWSDGVASGQELPKVGAAYARRRGSLLRQGRVTECLPPVGLTVAETLLDPPCQVRLRLRWRLTPLEAGCLLQVDARYDLNGAAYLNKRRWREQIHALCARLLKEIEAGVASREAAQETGRSGQSQGSRSMTVTNTTAVSGNPSLR